jgi:hypothetical protein
MGPVVFLMAIMGCGEGDASCQQVRLLETRYESQAACMAQSEAALTSNLDADFPVVLAECRADGAPPKPSKANDVRLPEPEQNPHYPIK